MTKWERTKKRIENLENQIERLQESIKEKKFQLQLTLAKFQNVSTKYSKNHADREAASDPRLPDTLAKIIKILGIDGAERNAETLKDLESPMVTIYDTYYNPICSVPDKYKDHFCVGQKLLIAVQIISDDGTVSDDNDIVQKLVIRQINHGSDVICAYDSGQKKTSYHSPKLLAKFQIAEKLSEPLPFVPNNLEKSIRNSKKKLSGQPAVFNNRKIARKNLL